MSERPKRPISVWIAQILLLLFALLFLGTMLYIALAFLSNGQLLSAVPFLAIYLVAIVVLLFGFWGLVRRKGYGRVIAVIVLSLFWLSSLIGQFRRTDGPLPYAEYENATEAMSGMITGLVLSSLLLVLVLFLIFSKKVSAFFQPEPVPDSTPPPPPTFDN